MENEYRESLQIYKDIESRYDQLMTRRASEDVPESDLVFFLTKLNQAFPSIMAVEQRYHMRKMATHIGTIVDYTHRTIDTGRISVWGRHAFLGKLFSGREVPEREGVLEKVRSDARNYPLMWLIDVEKMADLGEEK